MCTIERICNRCMGFVAMTTQRKRKMSALCAWLKHLFVQIKLNSNLTQMVGWLEFNVPSQHKYGYIRDEVVKQVTQQ